MNNEINISVAEMKAKLSEKMRACLELKRKFIITSHGKPSAVMISYKEYMGLIEKQKSARKIDAEKWVKQKEVAHDIKGLFDEKKLKRKGQKGYKNRAVKLMEGN